MTPPSKILAFDVGDARIGVATCDPLWLSVKPLTVIQRRSRHQDFDVIGALIRQEAPDALLCGLPLNMDGSEGPQAESSRRWARRLAQALKHILGSAPPIILWDERLSSYAADELMEGMDSRKSKIGQDAVAAAVILQSYLDAQRRGASEDYGRI